MLDKLPFREVWAVDFEYGNRPGERPVPVCCVARELKSGRRVRQWQDEFGSRPPYEMGPDSLFVSFSAHAELGCHLVLGWQMPANILDLYIEFRLSAGGQPPQGGYKLLSALSHHGLSHMDKADKAAMVALVLRGGPWSHAERLAVLDYCEEDVVNLERLLPAMLPGISLPHARIRGRFTAAAAKIEHNGTPIDVPTLDLIREKWTSIKGQLITEVDANYGVYEGTSFNERKFAGWLAKTGTPWPRLPTGRLALDKETFEDMAKAYPIVAPLRQLRSAVGKLRLESLTVGPDGRNRTWLNTFGSVTGRNQPSNSEYIFGASAWLRGPIKPPKGMGIAYIDWSQQEFGIAAALSRDEAMMAAYRSGDPYLDFAKRARAVPPDATKQSHAARRDQFKVCALGMQYGMGAQSLADRIGEAPVMARQLIGLHKEIFRDYWKWSARLGGPRIRGRFLKGPVLMAWLARALHVGSGSALGSGTSSGT
jgi:DNA polymerase-1